ncbi:MAG: hypothetical protein K2J39_12570 [Ruminococcus sp.]|nr:hypothetical protein [Ruminococcus sp.]
MTFRDLNAKNIKIHTYSRAGTLRDMNFRPVEEIPEESEPIPEKQVIPPPPPVITASRYQSVPLQPAYMNNPIQSMPLPNVQHIRTQQSVYASPNIANQFMNYSNPAPVQPAVPVPPVPTSPPEPQKPDPSEFVEERTETPPPKMVRVTIPAHKKIDNKNNDFGAFGSTFDNDPDQSTMITEIPVMDNIDDYKI